MAGKTPEAITQQTFAVLGAGSAGMGVVCMLAKGMVKHVRSLPPLYRPQQAAGYVSMRMAVLVFFFALF